MSQGFAPQIPAAAGQVGPDPLMTLVRRIAVEDRFAFTDLYDALSAGVLAEIRRTVPEPADATAVACATFTEVWSMARFHVTDPDASAWIAGIAARRAGERSRGGAPRCGGGREAAGQGWWATVGAIHDRRAELALAAALVRGTG